MGDIRRGEAGEMVEGPDIRTIAVYVGRRIHKDSGCLKTGIQRYPRLRIALISPRIRCDSQLSVNRLVSKIDENETGHMSCISQHNRDGGLKSLFTPKERLIDSTQWGGNCSRRACNAKDGSERHKVIMIEGQAMLK